MKDISDFAWRLP